MHGYSTSLLQEAVSTPASCSETILGQQRVLYESCGCFLVLLMLLLMLLFCFGSNWDPDREECDPGE